MNGSTNHSNGKMPDEKKEKYMAEQKKEKVLE